MANIERQAAFYLGREYDLKSGEIVSDDPVMYDARDLTTHAVCVGMTGSGKTGLGTILLEEAAMDGIPCIVIDPKGDMTNLLLSFPELAAEQFEPWVNVDDARRKDRTISEYASDMASLWRNGLGEWGQDGERIRAMKDRAEFAIYTPGSDAGLPVSVLQSFSAPKISWDDDEETLREIIASSVSGLLGLAGIEADPVQSREHILLSNIFEHAWRNGEDLSLATLIQAIQNPPMARLGVFDVDTFYPEKDRFGLAMALNRVIASPSFENWLEGPPLDMPTITQSPSGKARVSVFYIAHLNEAERAFFVTMLLQQVLSWMRQLSGTTSLRCLLYFDEVFGYLPPYPADPPTKKPLLTLLKTARAFGIGLILATQNPVDIDYKGLTNAGTWFIGKLQTERDKNRLLEGLESVMAESGTMTDRRYLDRLISSLDSRVFVLHNVHEDAPILFKTRWALSFLRGPLTRRQIRGLMAPYKAEKLPAPAQTAAPTQAAMASSVAAAEPTPTPPPEPEIELPPNVTSSPPRVNARVPQFYLPVMVSDHRALRAVDDKVGDGKIELRRLAYAPYALGSVSVLYTDSKRTQSQEDQLAIALSFEDAGGFVDWDKHLLTELDPSHLEDDPVEDALYSILEAEMQGSPPYTAMRNDLVNHIYRKRAIPLWTHPGLKLTSKIGETQEAFLKRCEKAAAKALEDEIDDLKDRYERDLDKLEDRLAREERELDEDEAEYQGRKREELLSAGESLVGMLLGRKRSTALSQASRKRRMTTKAKADIRESEETIEDLKKDIAEMLEEQKQEIAELKEDLDDVAELVQETALRPTKSNIHVEFFGLGWAPQWLFVYRDQRGTLRDVMVPAYRLDYVEGEQDNVKPFS